MNQFYTLKICPILKRLLATIFSLACSLMLQAPGYTDPGMIPSLEQNQEVPSGMTPISDLLQDTEPVRLEKSPEPLTPLDQKPAVQSESPAMDLKPAVVNPSETKKVKAASHTNKDVEKESEPPKNAEETAPGESASIFPAVDTLKRRFVQGMDMKQNLNMLGFSVRQHERGIKPVSYSVLPAIAIFPVVKHGNERAFGDLPLLFAREYALRIELKAPETKVYHPIYTVDELRIRGFGHVYDQVMSYYIKAGRPEPTALDYLLKQLAANGRPVSRVVFVEADLDMGQPDAATSIKERVDSWLTDGTPKEMKYFVRSRLQVFDADNPEFPMVWGGSWSRSIRTNRFMNVTPSVYADSDSQQAFARVSREMSRELMFLTPKEVYMDPQYDAAVQGKVVSGNADKAFPNLSELKPTQSRVSDENKKAIERILLRQNSNSP